MTKLFDLVSCPNYTYEVGAWLAFSLMSQTLTALLFASAGALQMTIWAKQKHRAYKKEFADKYPKQRKAIIPFVI
jgi:very-long-chain enoyl-CoA reductase